MKDINIMKILEIIFNYYKEVFSYWFKDSEVFAEFEEIIEELK